jgi:hypothetical protein
MSNEARPTEVIRAGAATIYQHKIGKLLFDHYLNV